MECVDEKFFYLNGLNFGAVFNKSSCFAGGNWEDVKNACRFGL
jgi:hypothetical protein